jgi:hypothetical protein
MDASDQTADDPFDPNSMDLTSVQFLSFEDVVVEDGIPPDMRSMSIKDLGQFMHGSHEANSVIAK